VNDVFEKVGFFTEALRLPAAERAVYLNPACAGDGRLRRKVEALLMAHDRVGDFLEMPSPECNIPTSGHSIKA